MAGNAAAGGGDAGGTVASKSPSFPPGVAEVESAVDEAKAISTPLPDSEDEMSATSDVENAENEAEKMEEAPPSA